MQVIKKKKNKPQVIESRIKFSGRFMRTVTRQHQAQVVCRSFQMVVILSAKGTHEYGVTRLIYRDGMHYVSINACAVRGKNIDLVITIRNTFSQGIW